MQEPTDAAPVQQGLTRRPGADQLRSTNQVGFNPKYRGNALNGRADRRQQRPMEDFRRVRTTSFA
jgi:hypothetical protein